MLVLISADERLSLRKGGTWPRLQSHGARSHSQGRAAPSQCSSNISLPNLLQEWTLLQILQMVLTDVCHLSGYTRHALHELPVHILELQVQFMEFIESSAPSQIKPSVAVGNPLTLFRVSVLNKCGMIIVPPPRVVGWLEKLIPIKRLG